MIQANLNRISPTTLERLAVLADQHGLSVEDYHEQMVEFWVNHPLHTIATYQLKQPLLSVKSLTERQKKLPDINEPASYNQSFIKQLLALPTLDDYDDVEIFPRANATATIADFLE